MSRLDKEKKNFNPAQAAGLEQRMALLKSFMDKGATGVHSKHPRFSPGQLTIIDLSDPFIDPSSACGLFEIVIRLFLRAQVGTGKVLVVDEAHKVCQITVDDRYFTDATFSTSLPTEDLPVLQSRC